MLPLQLRVHVDLCGKMVHAPLPSYGLMLSWTRMPIGGFLLRALVCVESMLLPVTHLALFFARSCRFPLLRQILPF